MDYEIECYKRGLLTTGTKTELRKRITHDFVHISRMRKVELIREAALFGYVAKKTDTCDILRSVIYDHYKSKIKNISLASKFMSMISVFTSYIYEPTIKTCVAESPQKRGSIPKSVRNAVWRNMFGNRLDAACPLCDVAINGMDATWHASHIIAHAHGGSDTEDNLRPLCGTCNIAVGDEHMVKFIGRCYNENKLKILKLI